MNPEQIDSGSNGGVLIKDIWRLNKTNCILVKTPDNKKKVFDNKLVWGYQEKTNTIYRNFLNHFLKVEALTDSIIIYSRKSKGYRGRLISSYFFSRKLDTPVYLLNKKNIYNLYKSNPCFLQKINKAFKWPYNLALWENKNSSFKIVNILNECVM